MINNKPIVLKKQSRIILSIIAYVSMLIDHTTYVIFHSICTKPTSGTLSLLYENLRGIGRLAFPIFVLFLVEGYFSTHSKIRYLLRIGLLVLISEVPFDLMNKNKILEISYQNVMFELFFGFILIWAVDKLCFKSKKVTANDIVLAFSMFFMIALTCSILNFDYGLEGIVFLGTIYLLKKFRPDLSNALVMGIGLVPLCIIDYKEFPAFLLVAIIFLLENIKFKEVPYKQNQITKWSKYFFYPVHMLCLYFVFMY